MDAAKPRGEASPNIPNTVDVPNPETTGPTVDPAHPEPNPERPQQWIWFSPDDVKYIPPLPTPTSTSLNSTDTITQNTPTPPSRASTLAPPIVSVPEDYVPPLPRAPGLQSVEPAPEDEPEDEPEEECEPELEIVKVKVRRGDSIEWFLCGGD